MKLPSLTKVASDARRSFARFPFVLLAAIAGTASALVLIDREGLTTSSHHYQVIFGAVLGLPLLLGLALVSEKRKWSLPLSLGLQVVGVVIAVLYALLVPPDMRGAPAIHVIRLLLLTTGLTLFALAAPYAGHKSELGYWNFCKSVVLRIVVACLYTVVLWIGLAVALAALDNLFGVNIPGRRYGELWVLLNGVFAVWFSLAGLPEDYDSLDADTEYPRGLKIFSQYILSPLVLVYLLILYAYLTKILVQWEWPEGWVSKLIFGFIGMGITSLLLLNPIKERSENRWIRVASKWFYVIIIPLLIMLFFAVSRRVSDYGITEGRYLAIVTATWLCIVVLYYIISAGKSIRFLPLSACIVVFVISAGPWGMFTVSEKSQVSRLKELLTANHILVDGHIVSKHDSIDFEGSKQMSSIISYLGEIHGFEAIQPWFTEDLKLGSGDRSTYKDGASVAHLLGIQYIRTWQTGGTMAILTSDRDGALDLAGYDHLIRAFNGYSGVRRREFTGLRISVDVGKDLDRVTVKFPVDSSRADSIQFDLGPLEKKLAAAYGNSSVDKIPVEQMTISQTNPSAKMKLWFSTIRFSRSRGENRITSFDFDLGYTLVGRK